MKRYVMIGAPVTTVRTPALLTEYLRGLGAAIEIETRHVDPGDLDAFMAAATADTSIDGLLVTMPHNARSFRISKRSRPLRAGRAASMRRSVG